MKRLSENYDAAGVTNTDLYDEIQARRKEREGVEGANLFDGITSNSNKDELIGALEADDKASAKASSTGRSTEKAGVGTPAAPEVTPIPEDVKIKRDVGTEAGTEITGSPKVSGDQSKLIIDIAQGRPVKVFLVPVKGLTPEDDTRLVFVQGAVSNELLPEAQARSRFACKADGTVIYNARGFDEVRAGADFDLVDIVKLIDHNHSKK